jgi:glycine hydroxymethyltransferase
VTSGIRIGTPALTTRGFGEAEMKQIGGWIAKILEAPDDKARTEAAGREVLELAAAYPMFAWEPVLR